MSRYHADMPPHRMKRLRTAEGGLPGGSRGSRSSTEKEDLSSSRSTVDSEEYLISNGRCTAPRAKIFLVTIISFVVAAVVVLVVIMTKIEPVLVPQSIPEEDQCIDVAIVGAGLAGSYTAWRMRHRNQSIHLFEASGRIGGRFYTRRFPNNSDVNLELGARYFIPSLHKLMKSTVDQLGLETERVYLGEDDIMYNLRKTDLRGWGFLNETVPYSLEDHEKFKHPMTLFRDALQQASPMSFVPQTTIATTSDPDDNNTITYTYDYSKELSVRNALMKYLGSEAYKLIEDVADPGEFLPDQSAESMLEYLTMLQSAKFNNSDFVTIKQGMDTLPVRFVHETQRVNKRFHMRYNTQVGRVEKLGDVFRVYLVSGEDTQDTDDNNEVNYACAKSVVLALPPRTLLKVQSALLTETPEFMEAMHSLSASPAAKLFLQIKSAKLKDLKLKRRITKTDIPLKEVYMSHYEHEQEKPGEVTPTTQTLLEQSTKNTESIANATNTTNVIETLDNIIDSEDYIAVGTDGDDIENGDDFSGDSANITIDVEDSVILQALQVGGCAFDYWQSLLEGHPSDASVDASTFNVTDDMIEHAMKHLSDLFDDADLANIKPNHALYHQWDGDLTEAAYYSWKPKTNRTKLMSHICKPTSDHRLFVVGSAYAEGKYQHWAEGALQTVDKMISQYFVIYK